MVSDQDFSLQTKLPITGFKRRISSRKLKKLDQKIIVHLLWLVNPDAPYTVCADKLCDFFSFLYFKDLKLHIKTQKTLHEHGRSP